MSKSYRSDGLFCACLSIMAVLAAYPFAAMGFIDDWSYIKTADEFANTGHFVYNGWATAMLGWQIPWGALFIKLFGFSFTAPRISTLFIAFVSVFLLHRILERFGLARRSAAFGALLLGLSPIFVPLAPTFMTDISGMFVVLVCIYMCLRAYTAAGDRSAILWLIAAGLVNVVGGTVRQIAWLGALVLVPSTAWLMRGRPKALATGIVLWFVSAAGIAGCLLWWSHVPYSLSEGLSEPHMWTKKRLPHIASHVVKAALCLLLVLLPLLSAWLVRVRAFSRRSRAAMGLLAVMLVVVAVLLARRGDLETLVMPWIINIIGDQATSSANLWMLGLRPVSLNLAIRAIISATVVLAFVSLVVDSVRPRPERARVDPSRSRISWQAVLTFTLPFSLAYVALLIPRAAHYGILDRYFLCLMPMLIVCLLKLYEERISEDLPKLSYLVLALFALYTVAGTHDWFSQHRAIVQVTDAMLAAGVPRTEIQAGAEYDGWTEIEAMGYVNDARIHDSGKLYQVYQEDRTLLEQCSYPVASLVPRIKPVYFLSFEQLGCLAPSKFGGVHYSTWLPPYGQSIYVLQRR